MEKETRICPVCGYEFIPKSIKQICCCHRCINVLVQRRWALKHKGEPPKNGIWVICAYDKCNKKFKTSKHRGRKYCCNLHKRLAISIKRKKMFAEQKRIKMSKRPLTKQDSKTVEYVMSLPPEMRFNRMEGWSYEMHELAKRIYLSESTLGTI